MFLARITNPRQQYDMSNLFWHGLQIRASNTVCRTVLARITNPRQRSEGSQRG